MSISIPSAVPKRFRAGDLVKWTRNYNDFPTSGSWTVKAYLVTPTEQFTITATVDGDNWLFTLTAAVSTTIPAGMLKFVIRAEDGSDIYTAEDGMIEVEADIAAATTGVAHSFARKALEALEAVIENRATQAHLSMAVAGRSISLMSADELMTWRDYFRAEVMREERAAGLRKPRQIQVEFTGS